MLARFWWSTKSLGAENCKKLIAMLDSTENHGYTIFWADQNNGAKIFAVRLLGGGVFNEK